MCVPLDYKELLNAQLLLSALCEKVASVVAKDITNIKGFTKEDNDTIEYKSCLSLFPSLKDN